MMRTMGFIYLLYVFHVGKGSNDISITANFPDTFSPSDRFCTYCYNIMYLYVWLKVPFAASDCKYRFDGHFSGHTIMENMSNYISMYFYARL